MKKKLRKEVSLKDRLGLFLGNYKKLHHAAITHQDEGVGRTAVEMIAGSKLLSEWDKNDYFGDTAIFSQNLSVAEEAWGRIEKAGIPEIGKLDRARFIASFSKHEPVAIDALDYIEKSEISEAEKMKHADYIGMHTGYLSVAKRTLNLILRSKLREEEKIPHVRHLAKSSKHSSIKGRANKWLGCYKIIKT